MLHYLMSHWQILALLAVLFSAGGASSNAPEVDEDLEWAAHPMNKEGMNWIGD
jgi:hypothetical protein